MTEDPLSYVARAATKFNSVWLRKTYPFVRFGARTAVHYSCDIPRSIAKFVSLGDDIYIAQHVWINIACDMDESGARIVLGDGCKIGRRSVISCKNSIVVKKSVLFAPGVLLMDHNHQYTDISRPISHQGVTEGGKITIEENCWLGYGSVVLAGRGELTVGRNSIVGANSVVTKSFPPFSILGGNPARLIKRFDADSNAWISP
jgi:acetyltransferase-like isoleucine patch superfamily enzyme